VGSGDNELATVTVVSPCNAWAVGYYRDDAGDTFTLVLRWNGTAWKHQRSPSPEGVDYLAGVVATSATNAWAVGGSLGDTLVLHWNGTAWKQQPSPSPGSWEDLLHGVDATSATNAWAVGSTSSITGGYQRTLVLRWNGRAWAHQLSPSVGTGDTGLLGVAATSPTNAWAVGYSYDDGVSNNRSLVLRWNGTAWKHQASPNVGTNDNVLSEVAATSPTNAWAVGYYVDGAGHFRTLVLHWNGTGWTRKPSPNVGTNSNSLYAVSAISATDAWAVGYYYDDEGIYRSLVLHWNGTAWKRQPSPTAGADDVLQGVAATSSTDAWAVGYYSDGEHARTLAVRWNGTAWERPADPA
jgi:hypothetical protein